MASAARAWSGRASAAGPLDLSVGRVRKRLSIVERRVTAAAIRFDGWPPPAREQGLIIVGVVVSVAPGEMCSWLLFLAQVSLRALVVRTFLPVPA